MFSLGGDMTVGMKDGVEYTIRFGGNTVARTAGEGPHKKADLKGIKPAKATESVRFVFVTARFNPDLVPAPMLDLVPAAKSSDKTKPVEPKTPDKEPKAETPPKKSPASSFIPKAGAQRGEVVQLAFALADPPAETPKTEAPKADETKPAAQKTEAKPADAAKPEAKKSDRGEKARKPPPDGPRKKRRKTLCESESKGKTARRWTNTPRS